MEGQEDTETSIMATNDEVKRLIRSWIEERELCAMEMKKLANELEIRRKNCTISKCVGSTVAVAGLIGAAVTTLITGGIVAPAIAAATVLAYLLVQILLSPFYPTRPWKRLRRQKKRVMKRKSKS